MSQTASSEVTVSLTQDNVPLSEMDKAAVLTLIREEVCLSHTLRRGLTAKSECDDHCFVDMNTPVYSFFFLALSPNQIITKEIEVNEWKRKYEESRVEVLEMRYEASLFLWSPPSY